MICLKNQKKIINLSKTNYKFNLKPCDYCIATIHREENCKRNYKTIFKNTRLFKV